MVDYNVQCRVHLPDQHGPVAAWPSSANMSQGSVQPLMMRRAKDTGRARDPEMALSSSSGLDDSMAQG